MGNENEGRVLSGFDEGEKLDILNSLFFKAETNIRYELTFIPLARVVPQGQSPITYELVEKDVMDFNDKTKMVKKVCLNLRVDSVNGNKVDQEWGILAKAVRDLFKEPCVNGNLLKKKYAFQSKGEGKGKTYSVSEIGDR